MWIGSNLMTRRTRTALFVGIPILVIVAVSLQLSPFLSLQSDGVRQSGSWEDDPQNWYRAFGEPQPPDVKVVHSKFWRSDHFTAEFIYYFEIEAPPEWKAAYFKKRGLTVVPPSSARDFRTSVHSDDTPVWFAPGPVDIYEVWDRPGYFGSVWVNKTNGHVFFYDAQL